MEEENNRELVFVGTLLKRKNGKISVLVYKKLPYMYPDKLLHYSSHDQKGCMECVVCTLFNRAYSIIGSKDELTKKITNNHSLSKSQQQMQATDIQEEESRMSKSQLNIC